MYFSSFTVLLQDPYSLQMFILVYVHLYAIPFLKQYVNAMYPILTWSVRATPTHDHVPLWTMIKWYTYLRQHAKIRMTYIACFAVKCVKV